MEGFRVRCRSCGIVMYETTKYYNCHKPLTGDMLRLLPLYKDWPTYDGSLANKSTSRFLMFCSQCSGYISTTGKLDFVDFPDSGVSKERSEMPWEDFTCNDTVNDYVDSLIINDAEDSAPRDDTVSDAIKGDFTRIDPQPMSPEGVIKKIGKGKRK